MATMQVLLEKDKERFLHSMAGAKTSLEAVHVVEEQLSRLLTFYNEDESSDKAKETALAMVESLRTSAGLLNCDGDSVIYSRAEYRGVNDKPKKSTMFKILAALGAVLAIAAAVVLIVYTDSLPPTKWMSIGLGLSLAALICLFAAGLASSKTVQRNKEDLYAETLPDGQKTYHILLAAAVSMDRSLNRIKSDELLANKQALLDEKEGMPKDEIELYCTLLEGAYAEKNSEYAKEVAADLKFYLHKRKIDVVDFNGSNKELFDRMPSGRKETIRPALVIDKTVIRKGLAAGE